MSVGVQLDLVEPGQDPGERIAIWAGDFAELPAVGAFISIRTLTGRERGLRDSTTGVFVVLWHYWQTYEAPATPESSTCLNAIVGVRRALPGEEPA